MLFFFLTGDGHRPSFRRERARAREAHQREREARRAVRRGTAAGRGEVDQALTPSPSAFRAELQITWPGDRAVAADGERAASRLAVYQAVSTHGNGGAGRMLHGGAQADGTATRGAGRWVRMVRPHRAADASDDDVHLVPMRIGDRRIGALLLANPAGAFAASDDRLVSAAAAQIGVAIERARLRQEATEAEILRRTDALRRSLLNAVSHDLRTPLATIMASAGSLRQQDVSWSEEERQAFAQAIEEEAQRLNRLVGNLLDLSRIEAASCVRRRAGRTSRR